MIMHDNATKVNIYININVVMIMIIIIVFLYYRYYCHDCSLFCYDMSTDIVVIIIIDKKLIK